MATTNAALQIDIAELETHLLIIVAEIADLANKNDYSQLTTQDTPPHLLALLIRIDVLAGFYNMKQQHINALVVLEAREI